VGTDGIKERMPDPLWLPAPFAARWVRRDAALCGYRLTAAN